MQERSLPLDIGFAPWTPRTRSRTALSAAARQLIQQVAFSEINQDYNAQTNLPSMYFSGKALAKFAMIVYTTHELLNETDLATQGLNELKGVFAVFATNQQIYPLVYDTVWNGIVSSGSYITGDSGQDFGNTCVYLESLLPISVYILGLERRFGRYVLKTCPKPRNPFLNRKR